MKILADATLPILNYNQFFEYKLYNNQTELLQNITTHDILLCRSTLKITTELLQNTQLQCIATASSGTDHIDQELLIKHKIKLFDAKGCNANSVANYVMACIAELNLANNHTVGIIGMGYVGSLIKQYLLAAGFNIYCYDPFKINNSFEQLMQCDILCIHANLHNTQPHSSYNLINHEFLTQAHTKIIINASRGNIVDENAILAHPKILYCTDVYANEPNINPKIIQHATICTPHIAGHSVNAKYNTMLKIRQQLHEYYHIPNPINKSLAKSLEITETQIDFNNEWKDQVLSIYNPIVETKKLKQSTEFEKLRKQHINRMEFKIS